MKSETNQAMATACRLLTARRRTRRELATHLERKRFSTETICHVLKTLEQYGYIDDKTFTRLWVEQRLTKRGLIGLKSELIAKGVDPNTINEIMAELSPDAEYNAAMALALKKVRSSGGNCPFPRMAGFLQRRGFSFEVIGSICRTLTDSGVLLNPADSRRLSQETRS